jgi:hypothetical protein
MESKKCQRCGRLVLYLETKRRISFAGTLPPVQKDGLCPVCWMEAHPGETIPGLPGWDRDLKARYSEGIPATISTTDPNADASRIVAESTADKPSKASGIQAAWAQWSAHIQNVDQRGMALLKAAFEAGYGAAQSQLP